MSKGENMKLNEVIAKYGNADVDESKIKEVLGVKESKVWKPKNDDRVWILTGNSTIIGIKEFSTEECGNYYQAGNCYQTKEEAEFARDKQIFLTKFERYLRENEDEPVDWENESQAKYSLEFNFRINSKISIVANSYYMKQGAIYTTNFEALNNFIKDNEADIKKYMFGLK